MKMKKELLMLSTSFFILGCMGSNVESENVNNLNPDITPITFDENSELSMEDQNLFRTYVETPMPDFEEFVLEDEASVDTLFSDSTFCSENDTLEVHHYDDWYYVPKYVSNNNFKKVFRNFNKQEFENPGKIYQYEDLRFVNEKEKGVHVYDISDKENPQYKTFFKIPGVEDVSIKDDLLYANSYTHLITINVSNMDRIFLESISPKSFKNRNYQYGFPVINEDDEFLYAVKKKKRVIKSCFIRYMPFDVMILESSSDAVFATSETENVLTVEGKGGSMARFAFGDDHLFYADHDALVSFEMSDPKKPTKTNTLDLDWGIETLFDDDSVLYVGSQRGTFIVDIKKESAPILASEFAHARSCDPIVVQDGIAYVTLSSGTACWNGNNELHILDVQDIYEPFMISLYELERPQGLGIDGEILYVCDGSKGLVSYNVKDPEAIVELDNENSYECTDVILDDDEVFAFGPKGAITYDISDPTNLRIKHYEEATGVEEQTGMIFFPIMQPAFTPEQQPLIIQESEPETVP